MTSPPQSRYFADRASAARLLRDSAVESCAAAVHDSFARLYDERSALAGANEAALLAQVHEGERRLAFGFERAASRAVAEDDRWIGEGGSILASKLAPMDSYGGQSVIRFPGS